MGFLCPEQLREKPVVSPTDIMMLGQGKAYIKFNGEFPYSKVKFPFVTVEDQAPSFIRGTTVLAEEAATKLNEFKKEKGLDEECEEDA